MEAVVKAADYSCKCKPELCPSSRGPVILGTTILFVSMVFMSTAVSFLFDL